MAIINFVKLVPDAKEPKRQSDYAVGYDVYASRVMDKTTKEITGQLPVDIEPGGSVLIGIGIAFEVPWGWQCEVRPRSGTAAKHDIELSNSPGTVDPDFRGEVGILLRNRGDKPFTVEKDMRIAQLVFTPVEIPVFRLRDQLSPTVRGTGGFGSTGLFGSGFGTKEYQATIARMDRFFMNIVFQAAALSNCVRGMTRNHDGQFSRDEDGFLIGQTHRFGCVIVKDDIIIGFGYNAQYPGSPLCCDVGCLRDELRIDTGTKLEVCRAIHAETWGVNAAAKSHNSSIGATMYVNAEPCLQCARMIAGSGIATVVIVEGVYPTNGIEILEQAGIEIRRVRMPQRGGIVE